MQKLGVMVKNNVHGKKHMNRASNKKYFYKPLTEKDVSDSFHIPKVNFKDFERHIGKTSTNANEYKSYREIEEQKRLSSMVK